MKLREQLAKAVETLDPTDALMVHELVQNLTSRSRAAAPPPRPSNAYLRVRKALRRCPGELSDDIREQRQDRA